MALKELLQEFVDKSYEELVDLASYSLVALCNSSKGTWVCPKTTTLQSSTSASASNIEVP